MSCDWGQIISFGGDIIKLWGHIISFWGNIISFWGRYPYWGQGSIGGKIIILWGDFELGARLLTYGGILLTFGGVIINNIFLTHIVLFLGLSLSSVKSSLRNFVGTSVKCYYKLRSSSHHREPLQMMFRKV